MTKVDIISGFLGAGKTTLIRKLIEEGYGDKKIIIIENEFGEIGVDTGFLKDTGVIINELTAGCICCTIVGDFEKALSEVMDEYKPDVIVIEPSGVGKLSDVISAVKSLNNKDILLNSFPVVVDAKKAKKYLKNFGEFFENQVENASAIILSHTSGLDEAKIDEVVKMLRKLNPRAAIVTTDWEELKGKDIIDAMEERRSLDYVMEKLREEESEEHHHEHDHQHEHHHEHQHEHQHEHHHEHDEHCGCGQDHHHHHHGHDADEVFSTVGIETAKIFNRKQIEDILEEIEDEEKYGMIIRAKGILKALDGKWIHFDYVPGEGDIREGTSEVTGILCVIGTDLKEDAIKKLFGMED